MNVTASTKSPEEIARAIVMDARNKHGAIYPNLSLIEAITRAIEAETERCARVAERDAEEWKAVSTNYLASDPMKAKAVSRSAMAQEIAIAIRGKGQ